MPNKCTACGNTSDNTKFDWINCDCCKRWYHGDCVTSSKDEYDILATNKFWICMSCIASSNIKNDTKKAITIALDELKNIDKADANLLMESVIDKIWPGIDELIETKIVAAIEEKTIIIGNLSDRISTLENKISKFERDWRKNNHTWHPQRYHNS